MPSKKVILSENAQKVAESRYFQNNEEWEDCCKRVARSISSIEPESKFWEDKFFNILYNMDFLPGGRILRNAGRPKGTLLNCFVLGINDDIQSIGKFNADSLTLWSEGGGVGANWSNLRPKGTPILGKGGESSGLVSFLKASDAIASVVQSGGQRRAAALSCCDISHPEIMDFINCKLKDGELSHYNISVLINEDFLKCVEADKDWTFKFNHKEMGTIKAREIWDLIMKNMCEKAEPGLLNATNLFKNNSWYFDPVTSTNPCGEHVGGPGTSCCLGSLVLPKFITGTTNTNWQKLEETIKLAVRFLDNVIDVNKYSLPEIDAASHKSRRIGVGIMGLADYLFMKELRYGSQEALLEIEKLMKFIRDKLYLASVELAKEKGAFPAFDPVYYGNSSFVRKLPAPIRMEIKKHGIRNVTLQAQAPNGTISLLADVSSGIEPLIFKSYKRADRVGERIYIHPRYKQLLLNGKEIPDWFVDMTDLTPKDHLDTQVIIQKYTDGACSKTLNMPAGSTPDQISSLVLEYIRDLKGVTVYVDGSKYGQVYQNLTEDEAIEYLAIESVSGNLDIDDVECNCAKTKDEETGEIIESCELPKVKENAA
jgi:ribonucleoside-diphosphate reductase alpha chain